ncbi:MAG TPA: hypothetical protein VGS18_04375, partial [Thermoplasmata archaeon]|nr:hypothetical protein [Thermoplasmata archaeon]
AALLADAATSSWFYWAMLANMIPLILWTRLARAEREALLGFAIAAAVGPFVLGSPVAAALGMALIMAVGFALLWRHLRRGEFTDSYARTAAVVWIGFLLMAAGAAASSLLPLAPGLRGIPFASAGAVVMLGEAFFLLRRGIGRSDRPPIGSPATAPSAREETSTGSLVGG